MLIFRNYPLSRFEFWGGAKEIAKKLTLPEFEQIEFVLEEIYPDGINETQLNDIFWFEDEFIAQALGYENFEKFWEAKK